MNRVYHAALELQSALKEIGRPYCFIGGLALQRWGEPRFTQDADATIISAFDFDEAVARQLLSQFKSRTPDGLAFALQSRVVLLEATNGVGLDVALGAIDFEVRATERASDWRLPDGNLLRTCSAEDLVVHKAFASRTKDWLDIEGIFRRQGAGLKSSQILADLRPLAIAKEDDTLIDQLATLMREHRLIA